MAANLGFLEAFMGLNLTGFTQGMATAQASMLKAGKSMQSAGRTMSRNVTLPVLAAGGASIKMAIDFQTSMRKINTLVGISSERVNEMSKDVMNLSNVTGESSKELGDALFVITSAGQRGAEAMQILEQAGKSAALGLGETKDIARAVTSVLNAYGVENISAAKATDQLLAVVREGNLEASELAPTLGRVIGLAATLGIGFDQVGASIATFTRLGVDSAEAVTGLRGIMNTLIKPTQQGEEALESLGMTFGDLRAMVDKQGLAQTLINLIDNFKGNEEALSALVPNVRALGAVLGTAGTQADQYLQIADSIANANGLVDDGFKAIAQDSGFKFKQTIEQLKNVGIEIGLQLLPIFNDFLNMVAGLAKKFVGLNSGTKRLILILAGLAATLGPILTILGTMAVVIGSISLPIVAVVAGIAALAAAINWIAQNWAAIKERISDWSWWRNMLIDMVQFLIEFSPFGLMIKGYNELVKLFGGEGIENPFEALADALDALKVQTKEYENDVKGMGETIMDAANQAGNALAGMFDGLTGGGGAVLSAAGGGGGGKGPDATAGLSDIQRIGGIEAILPPDKLANVATGVGAVTSKVFELGTAMQNTLNSAFTEFAETLGDVFSGDAGAGNFFEGLLGIVGGFMKSFGQALISAGVAALAFESLLINPIAAIGAGIALVAAATVIKNLLKKGPGGGGVKGLASGGFVTEGGLFNVHKKETVALPAGSAVTPARMNAGGGTQTIIVRGILSGGAIKFVLDEENRKTNNTF